MIYFIDDEFFPEYKRESAWHCFPAQDRADVRNRGGLEGKVHLADGSEQLMVCYPSFPPESVTRDDDWREHDVQEEFVNNEENPEMGYTEPAKETEASALEEPKSAKVQTDQTEQKQASKQAHFEQEEMDKGWYSRNAVEKERSEKTAPEKNDDTPAHTPYQTHQNSAWEGMQRQQQMHPMYSSTNPYQQQWGLIQDDINQHTMPFYSLVCQRCGRHWS